MMPGNTCHIRAATPHDSLRQLQFTGRQQNGPVAQAQIISVAFRLVAPASWPINSSVLSKILLPLLST
jgi:hypothetical protein